MNGEDKKMEVTSDAGPFEIVESEKKELSILVTDEDKYGTDITKMSNFFEVYIQQLSCKLSTNTMVDVLRNIPVGDIGTINDVVRHAEVMMDGKYGYVPDLIVFPTILRLNSKKAYIISANQNKLMGTCELSFWMKMMLE